MGITMASYALQTPPRVAHAKPPGPIFSWLLAWYNPCILYHLYRPMHDKLSHTTTLSWPVMYPCMHDRWHVIPHVISRHSVITVSVSVADWTDHKLYCYKLCSNWLIAVPAISKASFQASVAASSSSVASSSVVSVWVTVGSWLVTDHDQQVLC